MSAKYVHALLGDEIEEFDFIVGADTSDPTPSVDASTEVLEGPSDECLESDLMLVFGDSSRSAT